MAIIHYRGLNFSRLKKLFQKPSLYLCVKHKSTQSSPELRDFIKSELEISDRIIKPLLQRYPTVTPRQVKRSLEYLKSVYDIFDIKGYPSLLFTAEEQLNASYRKLSECGYENVTVHLLSRTEQIMRQNVKMTKKFDFLPEKVNVMESILIKTKLDIKLDDSFVYRETLSLQTIYLKLLKFFLMQRLDLSNESIGKLNKEFSLSNLSIGSVAETIDLLEKELCFSKQQISKSICLKVYPKNLRQLLDVKRVFNIDVKTIINEYPSFLNQNLDSILKTEALLRSHGIPEYSVMLFKKVFISKPEILEQRLKMVAQSKDIQALLKHPSLLKFLFRIDKILKKLPENDKNTQDDVLNKVVYHFINNYRDQGFKAIAHIFNKTEAEILELIKNHPFYKYVPLNVIERNIEYLLSQNFTLDEIYSDIFIIFYST